MRGGAPYYKCYGDWHALIDERFRYDIGSMFSAAKYGFRFLRNDQKSMMA